jgi:hypothetical protein
MSSKLFIHLLAPGFEFAGFYFEAPGCLIIVVTNVRVAIEAEGNCVVLLIRPAILWRNDVVNLNIDATSFLAEAAMSITPQQKLDLEFRIESHYRCYAEQPPTKLGRSEPGFSKTSLQSFGHQPI